MRTPESTIPSPAPVSSPAPNTQSVESTETLTPHREDRHLTPLVWLWLTDFVMFAGALWGAFSLRFGLLRQVWPVQADSEQAGWRFYLGLGLCASCLGTFIFERWGFYRRRFGLDRGAHALTLLSAVVFTYLLLHFPFLVARRAMSGPVLLLGMCLTMGLVLVVHLVFRWLQPYLQARGIGFDRTLLIGAPDDCRTVADQLVRHYGSQYPILGYLGPPAPETSQMRRLGDPGKLERVLHTQRVDHVLIASVHHEYEEVLRIVDLCADYEVTCRVLPDLFELITGRVTVGEVEGLPTITLGETPLSGSGAVVKRLEDLVLALIGLLITGLVMLILGPIIKLTSRGPVLYAQARVGLDGKVFTMYKFRTMRVDAETETGPVWAKPTDPRTTWIGKFMRRNNLDELPQFYNVLKGDMSVVGPRPERPFFINEFKQQIPHYMRRHLVKCGLTGWAQVCGLRGETSIQDRTRYDIWYVENWSLWLDLKIIFMTFWKKENAY